MATLDSAPTRLLVVMRHARAESWGESDHERRLAEQGRADAAAAGHWLAEQGIAPDHALVSSATRTRETWEAVAGAAGWSLAPVFDDGLYSASPDTTLDLMRETPDEARVLFVLGHNPTVAFLAQMLDDGDGDPAASADMAGGYPTCALTVLRFEGGWSDLAMASASVTAFHVGRD
ncbi:SixA phosphatase family protein [Nocardioides allogilvus]|uniref:SixA phosphatase family protein n=1 Tax=Nocardioides allogilvus TaxID=2072017 RepID=UPI001E28DC24|nr:histidine phosphatase family protein [Nocardioides allogilvus]